jgi:signal transduction histidine kinase
VRGTPMTLHRPDPAQLADPTLAYGTFRVLCGVPIHDDGAVIGIAKIGSLTADDFSMQDQRIFTAMVSRATLAIVQHALRERAQRTEQTRRFLDHATRALTRSLDHHETLQQIAQLAVPELADWCVVDLLDDGRIEHVAVVHANAEKRELANTYLQTHAAHIDAGTQRTLTTGQAQHAFEITDDMLAAAGVPRELGFRSWIGAPLVGVGEPLGVIHLIMSDSGRRHTDADLEVAIELGQRAGIAVANARLYRNTQEAVRLRDNVLAIVSHDLRNPLGAIDLGATLLLQQFGSDTRARKHLEMIRRSAGHMEALINDLLDMASINAKKLTLAPAALDAGELLAEALDIQEPVALERGIRIMRDNELAGVVVRADRNRLRQVLGNLMGNALKFCRPGDVVFARGENGDGCVRFVVADTGPGIARDELSLIFDPYWSGRATANKGTGLGLFITRAIVEAHHGSIEVNSEAGKGAEFTVTLPVA